MIVLDACAVLALLKGERAAPMVRGLLLSSDEVRLTAVGVAEVVDHLVRLSGAAEDEAALDLAQLGLAEALPVGAAVGMCSGPLRARRYHGGTGRSASPTVSPPRRPPPAAHPWPLLTCIC